MVRRGYTCTAVRYSLPPYRVDGCGVQLLKAHTISDDLLRVGVDGVLVEAQ